MKKNGHYYYDDLDSNHNAVSVENYLVIKEENYPYVVLYIKNYYYP